MLSEPTSVARDRPTPIGLQRWRRLRSIARVRPRLGLMLLLAPIVLIFIADLATRGDRLMDLNGRYIASYSVALIESAILWGLLLVAASARRGFARWLFAAWFVLFATVAIGGQLYFHRQYATYLNLDATLFGTSVAESLFGELRADSQYFLRAVAPPFVLSIALVVLGRRYVRPGPRTRRAATLLAPMAAVAVFLIPCSYRSVQASTPDVIYFHAIGGLIKQLTGVRTQDQVKPGLRTPPTLPAMTPRPARPRNVLFVLSESLRDDVHCSGKVEHCANAPRVNEAVPERIPLRQLRSNSSTTAIQLAVLWSGLQPVESREALHTAPLLFDYANAAGYGTAYWTSHHMMFANSRLFVQDLPTDFQCGATDLDPLADLDLGADDKLLTARIIEELPKLREPFFAVAHYGNTHMPYLPDGDDAPFQPAFVSRGEDDNEAYRNYYKNAVHRQDQTIADLIRFVRTSEMSERTVLVFTSDHGEAFREHGQIGHTGSILDEEIHVPGWVDAPTDSLTESERANLRAVENAMLFHTDMTPTVLDLLGLWEDPNLVSYRQKMPGQSWLRPRGPDVALALTNCTGIWGCAFANWGVMKGRRKLEAREWDQEWHCYDVLTDPAEQHDLGPGACVDLVQYADEVFGGLPGAP